MRIIRARVRLCFVATLISVGLVASGCGGRKDARTAGGGSGRSLAYPSGLSSASTPRDVAAVLIQALDADEEKTLMGLVAAKSEAAAVDAIYRQYGRTSDTAPEEAAALAAAGWGATYAFFQPGATEVTEERIKPAGADGVEIAVVTASGRNASTGEPRLLTIRLIREDGLWKVRAGLQAADAPPAP